ncbi:MAG: hypothetical protein QNJ46_17780 [Leptolyngbyaceae cyanobacterium MO_188.B28]|nr:hypothetical protein [Leptolyngbyaceae cyanobacterium MO_188.B28]
MALTPKEPESEVGRKARRVYLQFAQRVIGESTLDYPTLYQRFAENNWAAIKLDDAVAEAVLRAGFSPKSAVGVLHQGPYLQFQVHHRKTPLDPMSQYVRSTVLTAMQKVGRRTPGQGPSVQRRPELEID